MGLGRYWQSYLHWSSTVISIVLRCAVRKSAIGYFSTDRNPEIAAGVLLYFAGIGRRPASIANARRAIFTRLRPGDRPGANASHLQVNRRVSNRPPGRQSPGSGRVTEKPDRTRKLDNVRPAHHAPETHKNVSYSYAMMSTQIAG